MSLVLCQESDSWDQYQPQKGCLHSCNLRQRLQRPACMCAIHTTPHVHLPPPCFLLSPASLLPNQAGQMHSPKFSTSSRHSTRRQLPCSWLAWESSERSRRRDQMSCVGSTGSSSGWWVARPKTNCTTCSLWRKEQCVVGFVWNVHYE